MERATAAAWLKLAGLELGSSKFAELLRQLGSPAAVFDASGQKLQTCGLRRSEADRVQRAPEPKVQHIDALASGDIDVVSLFDDRYPGNLAQLAQADLDVPPLLFVHGRLEPDDRYAIAIVGTRKPTAYGLMVAERLARDFAAAGLRVVSGGASGIDTAAHRGSLEGGGRSLVVLGCGVDVAYPSTNRELFQKVATNGAVVSEFALGSPPDYWRFPIRNRTISGLSMGVVVVEAPERSGALITASCAAEQGRDVFVVPGSIDAASSKGSHGLLKDGAILIDSAQDVMEHLGVMPTERQAAPAAPAVSLSPVQQQVVNALSLEPVHPDTIARRLSISQPQLATELTLLEVRGIARRLPGGSYVRVL